MKQIIFLAYAFGATMLSAASSPVNAGVIPAEQATIGYSGQGKMAGQFAKPATCISQLLPTNADPSSKEASRKSKAFDRSLKDFKTKFPDVAVVKWETHENTRFAWFIKDSMRTSVAYDRSGRWMRTLRYLPVTFLPLSVREPLQAAYPDERATTAVEVNEPSLDCFIVHLEDDKYIREVAVYDGSTVLISQTDKAR